MTHLVLFKRDRRGRRRLAKIAKECPPFNYLPCRKVRITAPPNFITSLPILTKPLPRQPMTRETT